MRERATTSLIEHDAADEPSDGDWDRNAPMVDGGRDPAGGAARGHPLRYGVSRLVSYANFANCYHIDPDLSTPRLLQFKMSTT
jgi:hypothetical protein